MNSFILRRPLAFLSLVLLVVLYQNCFVMKPSRTQDNTLTNPGTSLTDPGSAPAAPTAAGSSTSIGGAVPLAGNFSSVNVNIFQPKCVACHGGAAPSGNYDMSDYTQIISGGRVVALSATTSPLYQRVSNGSMPPGAPLSSAEKQAIADWINNGAKNDGPPVTLSPTPTPVPLEPTFKSINANILQKSCITCHGGGGDDFNATSYASVMRSVVPGDATRSEFYNIINSGRMPPNAPLSAQAIQTVKTWIDNGAQNN